MHCNQPQVPIAGASAIKASDDLAQPRQKRCVGRPANDSERVETLHNLSVLDSLPDSKYEDITRLVTTIFNVPIAAVSLVDKDRLFFKSLQGLQYSKRQMDRDEACFCSYVVAQKDNEVLVVEDAAEDARYVPRGPLSISFNLLFVCDLMHLKKPCRLIFFPCSLCS